jgi:D-alanine-D-alanine ligase
MKKNKILLIYGGPSSEHEVSLKSGKMVAAHLDRTKYLVDQVLITKKGLWKFTPKQTLKLESALKYIGDRKYDVAFIVLHGFFGEDGKIQSVLESIRLPFTGSDMVSSAMAMDKSHSNKVFSRNGLLVPKFQVIDSAGYKLKPTIKVKPPFVVKPVDGGSSVGTSIVHHKRHADSALKKSFKIADEAMVQEYIAGREFTCGVIEKNGKPFSLVPTEIIPKSSFFDFKAKYAIGGSSEITPPNLPPDKIKEIQSLALKAHLALGCRGMSRSDFILKGSKLYILETNTIPGMTATSLLPQGAKAAGISFPELLDLIIQSAT